MDSPVDPIPNIQRTVQYEDLYSQHFGSLGSPGTLTHLQYISLGSMHTQIYSSFNMRDTTGPRFRSGLSKGKRRIIRAVTFQKARLEIGCGSQISQVGNARETS
ncbi:hypothetical protein AJ79_02307 [Helicocarpus griseus UAMH5409]|uniref:Uncharacterized protein n=1 Tax=Helicocarpus griseus UAMH5409 TaxID=1447875 RepID=A0A2B7Y2V2_9EURO|nr:hypothetical protein AJ79_02307 [Helicocarpus griseus UAMH5409]